MAYLEIETSDGRHRVSLERDRLSIGRLSYNDVVLPYAQVSRQHAEMRLINGQWWIADLHSTNGLQINSRRIQEHALANGDQIVIAPGISVRYVQEETDTRRAGQQGHAATSPRPGESGATWAERLRQQFALPGNASPTSTTQPGQIGRLDSGPAPFVPPDAVAPLRPRSPFADDEVRYVPPSMQPPTPQAPSPEFSGYPTARPAGAPHVPATPGRNGGTGNGSGGYPAPPGPLRSSLSSGDLFLRDGPADERLRATAGPAPKLLHVCQTCGQLTAPDSVYCQSCHHSIARECSNCRLSLLPIQERCPRCHTPNQFSVRRSHPGRTGI